MPNDSPYLYKKLMALAAPPTDWPQVTLTHIMNIQHWLWLVQIRKHNVGNSLGMNCARSIVLAFNFIAWIMEIMAQR